MTDELPTGWKRNPSLGPAILAACEADGMGWYGQWRVSRALRRLSDADWAKLERKCTALATEAGLPMGTNDIVADCYVGEWGDGTFFQMLIDSLPKILEFIKALLPLFMLFATLLLCCGLFTSTASAQCSGGKCTPVRTAVARTKQVVVEKQPVRKLVKEVRVERQRRVVNWLRRR